MIRPAPYIDAPRRPLLVVRHPGAAEAGARPPDVNVAGLLRDRDLEVDLARDARQPRQPRRDPVLDELRAAAGGRRGSSQALCRRRWRRGVCAGRRDRAPHRLLNWTAPSSPTATCPPRGRLSVSPHRPWSRPATSPKTAHPPQAPRPVGGVASKGMWRFWKGGCDKGTWASPPRRTSGRPRRSAQACAGGE